MKKTTIYTAAFAALVMATGCKKQAFVDLNTNPDVLYSIKPEEQFFNAGIQIHNQDFEQFYDNFRRTMYWMQMSTGQAGNSGAALKEVGNTNQRLSIYMPALGTITTDVGVLISKMSDQDKAARTHLAAMAEVLKIYYAFYVSDIN
ncbi:MAG TPA: hypothetical protein PKD90_19655, partial [Phnomibacter sp.]|nr:hypothetical protein [Phnomibacter sp.]